MANSYFAKYKSKHGGTLVGGVKDSQTSRFGSREDAETRLQSVIEINNNQAEGEIVESDLPPEIFIHCGHIAQAIGGRCFGCGKVLTSQDARDFCENK